MVNEPRDARKLLFDRVCCADVMLRATDPETGYGNDGAAAREMARWWDGATMGSVERAADRQKPVMT